MLVAPLVFRAPEGPAAREARRPHFVRRRASKPARALRSLRRPPHRRRLWFWCAVMASPVSASHAVQSSPCVVSCWRQRYKVRHACEKRAKVGHFERAGRVLYRQWPGAVLGGGVLRCLGTVRVSSCRPPAAHGRRGQPIKSLQRSLHRQWWGFCSIRNWLPACRRRVTPLMTPFPPLRGAEVAA